MKLNILEVVGTKSVEKKRDQEGKPVLRNSIYHVKEIFFTLFNKKIIIDGSSKIHIEFGSPKVAGDPEYEKDNYFNVTAIYDDSFDYNLYLSLSPYEADEYALNKIKNNLLKIVEFDTDHDHKDEVISEINKVCILMKEKDFSIRLTINKLCKTSSDKKYKAYVYRIISRNIGEAWCVEIISKDGLLVREKWISTVPSYIDRTDIYKQSKWIDNNFYLYDKNSSIVGHICHNE